MRCLDLFCGAGGAGMGYHQAGFEVVGWDIEHHPDYPFEHHVGDALDVLADVEYIRGFDLVHASPPCQAYSTATRDHSRHPDLVGPVRDLLVTAGVPYIIENVPQAPLLGPVMLCGSGGRRVRGPPGPPRVSQAGRVTPRRESDQRGRRSARHGNRLDGLA